MSHLQTIKDCNDIDKMKIRINELSKNDHMDEAVMYILVNSNIKMEKGKTANQCSHSACRVTRLIENANRNGNGNENLDVYNKWINNFEPKIILKCNEQEMKKYIEDFEIKDENCIYGKDVWCIHTRDIGRTQIEFGSLTTIAFCPIIRRNTPESIKKLKLL